MINFGNVRAFSPDSELLLWGQGFCGFVVAVCFSSLRFDLNEDRVDL